LTTDAVIVVRNLFKVFGATSKVNALRGLDLTVAPGEFVAVMGASGSGKSTLLHLLAGLDRPTSGSIHLAGVDLACLGEDARAEMRRHQLGLVFQAFNLLETLTAEENVLLPLAIAGCSAREARQRASQALDCVGLAHRRHHRPDQLSGGEKQRVAIARALIIDPVILLADEPTGNLDSAQGGRIMDLLRSLVDDRSHTLLMVTHDASHAARADRILRLHDGQLIEETTCSAPTLLPMPWVGNDWTHGMGEVGRSHSAMLVPTFVSLVGPQDPAPDSRDNSEDGAGSRLPDEKSPTVIYVQTGQGSAIEARARKSA
jgi:putative ABC transport system ATP-binding protein